LKTRLTDEKIINSCCEDGMNEIKLSTNLINSILQYIGTRPYSEVFQIVEAIQKEAKEQIKPEITEE
jgi:hypothetical protein